MCLLLMSPHSCPCDIIVYSYNNSCRFTVVLTWEKHHIVTYYNILYEIKFNEYTTSDCMLFYRIQENSQWWTLMKVWY